MPRHARDGAAGSGSARAGGTAALLSEAMSARGRAPTGAADSISRFYRGDRHAPPSSPAAKAGPSTRPLPDEPADRPRLLRCRRGALCRSRRSEHADGAADPPAGRARRRRSKAGRRSRRATAMSAEKIGRTAPGAQGGALRPPVLGPSGPAQPREPGAAVRHARPARAARLVARSRSSTRTSAARPPAGPRAPGFERMVAEVCLGKVGAVAAREVSRFARNSRDWQQLVEMCRVVDTLLIDQETVYAPRQGNDRLLLGLKGSLNEYELDLLRQRSLAARHEKARRGELVVAAPVGFIKVRRPAGEGPRPARAGGDPARHRQGRRTRQRAAGSALVPRARARPADQDQRRCRWSGVVRATRPSTSSSPTPPMAGAYAYGKTGVSAALSRCWRQGASAAQAPRGMAGVAARRA